MTTVPNPRTQDALLFSAMSITMIAAMTFAGLLVFWQESTATLLRPWLLLVSMVGFSALAVSVHRLVSRHPLSAKARSLAESVIVVSGMAVAACLIVWSSNVLNAVFLSLPVITCCLVPVALRLAGLGIEITAIRITPSPSHHEDTADTPTETSVTAVSDAPDSESCSDIEHGDESAFGDIGLLDDESDSENGAEDIWTQQRLAMIDDRSVSQQMGRWQVDGQDTCMVLVRCELGTGQTNDSIHVPLWPFFESAPQCYVEVVDGPDTQVKVSESHPFGLKLDLKRQAPADKDASVLVEIIATAQAKSPQSFANHDAA